MQVFMGLGIGMAIAFVLAVIIGGFFMWIAAKIARVERSTFGRAMIAAIGASVVAFLLTIVFHLIPLIGNALGFLIGLFLTIFVIKWAFDTSTGKAVLVWIFNIAGTVVAVLIASIFAAGMVGLF
jgi:hypothetical protein